MSLKELTADNHAKAETTAFMKAVFAKTMPMNIWIDYTFQKHLWYLAIENAAREEGLLENLSGIERADLIKEDFDEMNSINPIPHSYKNSTLDYVSYIRKLTDPKKILAHLYTWHMGDMYGGQMIKKIIDAPHKHLEFENVNDLIVTLRGMLSEDMADEANVAFDWAIRILSEYDESLG
jgi:hypothetical protein